MNAVDDRGMTALHLMLKKNSATEHFLALARFDPRYDIPGPDGVTAAELLARKRDPPPRPRVTLPQRTRADSRPLRPVIRENGGAGSGSAGWGDLPLDLDRHRQLLAAGLDWH